MPKNSPEAVFKPIFRKKIRHFWPFFPLPAFRCPALICASSCELQNGLSGFSHEWRSGSHWFRVRNSWRKKDAGL